jgi:Asp-tRNA(Asn)/Glu-tRNA(Gln) amidotransferase C subunit
MTEPGDNAMRVTAETVRQLARLAELPLPADRVDAVAEQLNGLLIEANLVNRYMDARREVQPAVRFHHPGLEDRLR